MTKGYSRLIKTVSSASSNRIEQKIFLKKETTSNDNLQQSSQKFIQKLRKLTIKPVSSKQEEQKTNDTLNTLFENILITQPSISESNEEPKLKGILRNSNQNLLCCDSTDESCNKSHCEIHHTTDNTNVSNDDNKTCSTLTSPKTNKHVRFDDKISEKKFKPSKPSKPVLSVLKLSNRQEKKFEKLQRNDSLNLPTMNFTRINPINSLKFQQIDYSDCSEGEPSDSDDS